VSVEIAPATDASLLATAQAGDDAAFERLIEPHREAIHGLCYRMLGSVHDADDALQDSLLRAWRSLARFDGRSELRTWLHRIATNVCLDALKSRPRRLLPVDYGPPAAERDACAQPVGTAHWLEPYPEDPLNAQDAASPETRYARRETLELAFVAALQFLPPQQRAVLVLRDILNFSAKEVAGMLGTSAVSVNSALQRARESVAARVPAEAQQDNLRRLGDARLREIVRTIIDAFERGDVATILAMMAEDAAFSMPPHDAWYRGREEIAKSWLMPAERPTGLRIVPTRANGQVALGLYRLDDARERYLPIALEVLSLRGELIAEVTSFRDPAVVRRFGLPCELALDD
jgi:RNA polymerase sigma-70 factor (ECF subfamily)